MFQGEFMARTLKTLLAAGAFTALALIGYHLTRPEPIDLFPIQTISESSSQPPESRRKHPTIRPIQTTPFREQEETKQPPREEDLPFTVEHYLTGKVTTSTGAGISNVSITPYRPYFFGGTRDGLEELINYTTDTAGAFTIPVPENTSYDLHATSGSRTTFFRNATPDTPAHIIFSNRPTVTATVLDAKGNPVTAADTTLTMAYPFPHSLTSTPSSTTQGTSTFTNVEEGVFTLITKTGTLTATQEISVFEEDINVTLTLPPGVSFDGNVFDADTKKGISSAVITLTPILEPLLSPFTIETNATGSFTCTLSQGDYTGDIRADGYVPLSFTRQIPTEDTAPFILAKPCALEGRILNSNQHPVGNANVFPVTMHGSLLTRFGVMHTTTNNGGIYTLPVSTANDRFGLIIVRTGLAPHFTFPATITDKKIEDLVLTKGYTVGGVVTTENGAALNNVPVTITPSPEWIPERSHARPLFTAWTKTNDTGAFTLTNIAPGPYILSARTANNSGSESLSIDTDNTNVTLALALGRDLYITIHRADGRTASSTNITLTPHIGKKYHGVTDETGQLILKGIPLGGYRIFAFDQNTRQQLTSAFQFLPEDPYLHVQFSAHHSTQIRVSDQDSGIPVPHITLSYYSQKDGRTKSIEQKFLSKNGYFDIFLDGEHITALSINAAGYSPTHLSLEHGVEEFYSVALKKR